MIIGIRLSQYASANQQTRLIYLCEGNQPDELLGAAAFGQEDNEIISAHNAQVSM
jgi:hypothetical protein